MNNRQTNYSSHGTSFISASQLLPLKCPRIESQQLEWKEVWRYDFMRGICGIANTFFRAGEIEAWGRGIQRIFEACHAASAPKPQLRISRLQNVCHLARIGSG